MENTPILQSVIDNIEEGVYFVDRARVIRMWNAAAQTISGYAPNEVTGMHCHETQLNHIDSDGHPLCELCCPLYATMNDGKQRSSDVLLRHKNGHRVPIKVRAIPVYEGDKIIGALEIFTPTSPIRYDDNLVESLTSFAMRDALTGLPNRSYMESYLSYRLQEYERAEETFSVLFADVDNFAHFNNNYGHAAGDEVLKAIASSFNSNMRRIDTMGRWGGEEFLAVLDTKPDTDLNALGQKVCELFAAAHVEYEGKPLHITVSIGITGVQHGDTVQSIVNRADALMYESKRLGKNRCTTK